MEIKCNKCGKTKEESCFEISNKRTGNRRKTCKVCRRRNKRHTYSQIGKWLSNINTRAKRMKCYGTITPSQLVELLSESKKCTECKINLNVRNTTIDHIYPLSLGGVNIKQKIKILCNRPIYGALRSLRNQAATILKNACFDCVAFQ